MKRNNKIQNMAKPAIVIVLFASVLFSSCSNKEKSIPDKNANYNIERTILEDITLPDDAQGIIDTVLRQQDNIKEYHVNQNMKCDIKAAEKTTSLYRKCENTIFKNPLRCEILTSSNLSDFGEDNRFYVFEKNGKYIENVNIDGDVNKTEIGKEDAKKVIDDALAAISPGIFLENKISFSVKGAEKLDDGTDVKVLSGTLTPNAINNVLRSSGISNVIDSNLLAADVVCDAGVTVYVDDLNGTVKLIVVDMKDYMIKLFEKSTTNVIEGFSYMIEYDSVMNVGDFNDPKD